MKLQHHFRSKFSRDEPVKSFQQFCSHCSPVLYFTCLPMSAKKLRYAFLFCYLQVMALLGGSHNLHIFTQQFSRFFACHCRYDSTYSVRNLAVKQKIYVIIAQQHKICLRLRGRTRLLVRVILQPTYSGSHAWNLYSVHYDFELFVNYANNCRRKCASPGPRDSRNARLDAQGFH